MNQLALPADTVRFYNDGPDFPTTPLLQEAERAYRQGFACVASSAASWKQPADDMRESLWRSRREVRRRAEVLTSPGASGPEREHAQGPHQTPAARLRSTGPGTAGLRIQ